MENGELKMDNRISNGMKFRYRTDEEMKESGVEWIGKIPNKWERIRVGHLCELGRGRVISNEEILDNKGIYPVYSSQTKDNGVMGYINTYDFEGEYVTWTTDGANAGTVFKRSGKFNCTNVCGTLKSKKSELNLTYLSYALSIETKPYVRLDINPKLMNNEMSNIKICFTKNEEQEKIVKFLNIKTAEFDSIISKKEALIEKLEEAKKSLISEVVTGKVKVIKTEEGYQLIKRKKEEMKDSGVEWLGDIPKEWDIKRLRFLGSLQNGISKSSEEFGFGYPFISYGDTYKNIELPKNVNGLVNSNKQDREIYSVIEGDVLFTRTSETVEEIGFASTCLETIKEATFAGFLIRFRPNTNRLFKGFSKYYFRCDLNRKFFVKEMNLVTRASLSQNLLNNLSVVLPSYEEQIEIYSALELKVNSINVGINTIKYQIEKLKEAKQSLISEAVTGKIEILD